MGQRDFLKCQPDYRILEVYTNQMPRFIIAFAACWHVYLMILSCFQAWKHVTVAAVECSAAQGTSWWLSSASATTKSSTMHGAMPDCFGSAARARAVICRMLANYSRTGVSREGQELRPMCILVYFRQGMEIFGRGWKSSRRQVIPARLKEL